MKINFTSPSVFLPEDVIKNGAALSAETAFSHNVVIDCSEYVVFPGFVDVHVHFRQPGFSYKETILTGSKAAARGGYTAVCTMPNLDPVPDCPENLRPQLEVINRDAVIKVLPFGSITEGEKGNELSRMEELAPFVCGFSDDGRGVDSSAIMEEAMRKAAKLGLVIAAHCEDGTREKDSPEAEWKAIERDIELCRKTGVKYHVCHISSKESVALIRRAKADGVDITCETAPHYLLLSDKNVKDDGRYRMNPPLREEADRLALLEGIKTVPSI